MAHEKYLSRVTT